ncbi:lytic transglycosylase domain-containing protein [Bdellovibrio bacteriovorus]|uniref:lytic transglycosylase domain-containing protein n=1 Tax=Bdellovibrio bacteriovorus TaxID=959 RepID=UPI0035A60A3B
MKSLGIWNFLKNIVSKRHTRGVVVTLTTLTLLIGLFNSASFPIVVQQIKKIQRVILDGVIFTRDPDIVYHREEILSDYEDRISEPFTISEGLRPRVGFWFDIYTRYDSNKKVVHHTMYPWIVFKVIDVTSIVNAEMPKARWMRNLKAEEFVTDEVQNIREALRELARTGDVDTENEYQVAVAEALEGLEGSLKEKAKDALKNVRVQTGQKNFFAEGLEVSPLYLSGMEEIFRNHKLPVELTRLPFVESSFNRHAVSKVGASGIWQFMDYTGKSFMTVNEHIDERNSPFKATDAAARLLKENHMILHRSWPLAITAWNHGPSGIRRAIKAADSKELEEIIENYQSKTFDFASSNFYCEFLAALYAEKYHDQIFEDLEYEKTLDLHTVKLARAISAKELLRRSGLAKEDFILYNPDLKKALERNTSIPSGFTLMVDTPARLVLKSLLKKRRSHSG